MNQLDEYFAKKQYPGHADYEIYKIGNAFHIASYGVDVPYGYTLIQNALNKQFSDLDISARIRQEPQIEFDGRTWTGLSNNYVSRQIEKNESFISFEFMNHFHDGSIDALINDNKAPTENTIGFYGLCGYNKPQRDIYKELAEKYEYIFLNDYINADTYIKIIEQKKHKYLIDLKGHTYSTKSLWLLFSRRAFFSNHYKYFTNWWEPDLVPWEHYIPVEEDLSDLPEKYKWAEENAIRVQEIINNAFDYAINNLTLQHIIDNVLTNLGADKFAHDKDIGLLEYLKFNKIITNNCELLYYKTKLGLTSTTNIKELQHFDMYHLDQDMTDSPVYQTKVNLENYCKQFYPNSLVIIDD